MSVRSDLTSYRYRTKAVLNSRQADYPCPMQAGLERKQARTVDILLQIQAPVG